MWMQDRHSSTTGEIGIFTQTQNDFFVFSSFYVGDGTWLLPLQLGVLAFKIDFNNLPGFLLT